MCTADEAVQLCQAVQLCLGSTVQMLTSSDEVVQVLG
jgi:hypothetical protein